MLKKISYLLLISFFCFGFVTGDAWGLPWYWPLYPGCHVIDGARFNESVLVTAQVALDAIQTDKMYQYRLLANEAISEAANNAKQLVTNLSNQQAQLYKQLTGPLHATQIAINPDPKEEVIASAWRDFKAPTDEELGDAGTMLTKYANMREVEIKANYDALRMLKKNLQTSQQLSNEVNAVCTAAAAGNLGQKQAANMARGYMISMMLDDMAAESAVNIATTTKIKKEIVINVSSDRQLKRMDTTSYDPYNRTDTDNKLSPEKPSIGFPNL